MQTKCSVHPCVLVSYTFEHKSIDCENQTGEHAMSLISPQPEYLYLKLITVGFRLVYIYI